MTENHADMTRAAAMGGDSDGVSGALDDSVDMSVYSPQSPMGAAIVGKRAGESAMFAAPNGKSITVEIVDAKPFTG